MNVIAEQFNNRELSILFWLAAFFVWFLGNRKRRNSFLPRLRSLLTALFHRTILTTILLMSLYVSLIVVPLERVGLWNATNNLKDTMLWTITVAFVMIININEVQKDEQFFQKTVRDSIKFTIVLEFIVGLYPFSLPVELALIPTLALLGVLIAVSEMKQGHFILKRIFGWLLALFGIVILGHSVRSLLADSETFENLEWLIALFLPSVLTLFFLPFVYLLALLVTYQTVFIRLSFQNQGSSLIGYAKRRIVLNFGFQIKKLLRWSKKHPSLKFNDKEAFLNLIKEPIQPAKNLSDTTSCSLTKYRSLVEPLMNKYRDVAKQIDPHFVSIKNQQSAITIISELETLQREVEQTLCSPQFPLKHETLLFTIKHTIDALVHAGKGNYESARQALNRALLNQQRFDNWNADIEPFTSHS